MNKIKSLWLCFIECKIARGCALGVFAVFGWLIINSDIPDFLISDYYNGEGKAPLYFAQFIATLPILGLLWVFRTYDTRQQIEKAETQIKRTNTQTEQSNFADGARFLVANNSLEISVGVKILVEVSRQTDEFDSQIRLAFAKRLERLPDDVDLDEKRIISIDDRRVPYIRAMFMWILRHHKEGDDIGIYPNFHYKEFEHRSDRKVTEAVTDKTLYLCSVHMPALERLFKASVSSDNIWVR